MKDFYLEQIVKRKNTKRTMLLKIILIVAALAAISLVMFSPFFLLVPVIILITVIHIFRITNVEYEYIYFNGTFDVDKIFAKKRRKRILSTSFQEIEVVAPTGSLEVQQYRKVKKINLSSRTKGIQTYQMVINHKGIKVRVVFEPNEKLLEEMKLSAPRKVYI